MATVKTVNAKGSGAIYNAVQDLALEIEFQSRPQAVINGWRLEMDGKGLTLTGKDGARRRYPANIRKCNWHVELARKVTDQIFFDNLN